MKPQYDFSVSTKNLYINRLSQQKYKVKRISKIINDDFPLQTIEALSLLDALRKYCATNGFETPAGTYHSSDDVYTVVSDSNSANVIGKFLVYKIG